jgi:hypothetical protein
MGKAVRASALILLMTCSAHAGYIPNGSPEPPPPNAVQEEQMANGNIPNDEEDSSLTETVLNLLESVLALL